MAFFSIEHLASLTTTKFFPPGKFQATDSFFDRRNLENIIFVFVLLQGGILIFFEVSIRYFDGSDGHLLFFNIGY